MKNNQTPYLPEIVVAIVAAFVALLAGFALVFHPSGRSALISLRTNPEALIAADLLGASIVILAVCVVVLLFRWQKRSQTVRLMNMGTVVSDQTPSAPDEKVITMADNEGTMKLSVRLRNIYYIESDDNYIKVWYQDYTGSVKQYMLRCRLKTVEESFTESDLVRCHRKYIINISKVQVLSKEKDGYQLDLGVESIGAVPVSKTYEAAVLSRFNSR
ncbi:MAG: LytTR family transcriptional regulator [Bacteroidales bacterium]|nr:LytTR family transcriptional regulator [Bacteroidales bacterium]